MYSVRVVLSKQHTCRYNSTEEDKDSKSSNFKLLVNLIHSFGNKELISLLSITLNYVVSVRKGFISSLCVGWAVLFSCGTTWAFRIIIFHSNTK